jgi:outer membrane protein assembly factor BamE (lipoprotein component of BamABCDE complex)
MAKRIKRHGQVLMVAAFVVLSACAPTVRVHGFAPTKEEIAQINPGTSTRESVQELIGLPSSTGVMEDNAWYYVQSETSQYTFFAPKVIDRRVLAITFDNGGRVTSINEYGLEDGRVINLQTRITVTEGAQLSVIQEILSNFGRFDATQLVGSEIN